MQLGAVDRDSAEEPEGGEEERGMPLPRREVGQGAEDVRVAGHGGGQCRVDR